MVKCPKCGKYNKYTAKFCRFCGHKLPNYSDVNPYSKVVHYKVSVKMVFIIIIILLIAILALFGEWKYFTEIPYNLRSPSTVKLYYDNKRRISYYHFEPRYITYRYNLNNNSPVQHYKVEHLHRSNPFDRNYNNIIVYVKGINSCSYYKQMHIKVRKNHAYLSWS